MIILTIKTDQETAEAGLFDSQKELAYVKWKAHRELSSTIHKKIEGLLDLQKLGWYGIEGLIFYEGPGSFTGLRIGASVANVLAQSLDKPIVQTTGKDWIGKGVKKLLEKPESRLASPKYGSPVFVTKPRK